VFEVFVKLLSAIRRQTHFGAWELNVAKFVGSVPVRSKLLSRPEVDHPLSLSPYCASPANAWTHQSCVMGFENDV
jgi:hypothetical protein